MSFSQLCTRHISSHHFNTFSKLFRHSIYEFPKIEKPPIKISIDHSRKSKNIDAPLKCPWQLTQLKRHATKNKRVVRTSKCGFVLIFQCNSYLVIPIIVIQKTIILVCKSVQHLINKRQEKVVLLYCHFLLVLIHINPSSRHCSCWD